MTKKVFLISLALMLALSLGVIGCTTPTEEEEEEEEPEVIELILASTDPSSHQRSEVVMEWIEKIEEETNGQVKITTYWGGTLIGYFDSDKQLQEGVADIAQIMLPFATAGYDLNNWMVGLYYGSPSWQISHQIDSEIRSQFSEIGDELAQMKILNISSTPPYHIMTCEKPIRTLADFQGLEIKSGTSYVNLLSSLGASAVNLPMSETYFNLEKSIVDGLLGPWEVLSSFSLAEVVKYRTVLNLALGPIPIFAMNIDVWNSLPADIQEVFEDNIQWFSEAVQEAMEEMDAGGIELANEMGVELIELSPEDLQAIYETMEAESITQAEELDAKGLPGTQIFQEIRRLIEEYS